MIVLNQEASTLLSHHYAKPVLIVFLGLASLVLFVPLPGKVYGQNVPFVGVFSSYYFSSNITDTSLVPGSTFAVEVNVTNAPPFNGYELVLYYDQNYISVSSYDTSTGTVFDDSYVNPSSSFNGAGALRLSVVNLNNQHNNNGFYILGSGLLVNILFSVKAEGVSPLVLAAGMSDPSVSAAPPSGLCPLCPTGTPNWTRLVASGTLPDGTSINTGIGVDTSNGYFKNVAGKSGPIASFSISPTSPEQGTTVTFNATASFDPDNPTGILYKGIVEYFWDFGDRSRDANTTVSSPITTHTFVAGSNKFLGNFSIRLTVIDQDDNFQGMAVTLVTILRPAQHCVAIEGILTSANQVNPGQNLTFSVQVHDTGTYAETFNLTITYGPPNATLAVITNQNIAVFRIKSYPETISTSHLLPGVYNIAAIAQLANAQNCSQASASNQFGVIPPNSGSAVLLLVGGVAGITAALTTVGVFVKRMRRQPEPP